MRSKTHLGKQKRFSLSRQNQKKKRCILAVQPEIRRLQHNFKTKVVENVRNNGAHKKNASTNLGSPNLHPYHKKKPQ
jgi:hypothetical protein